MTLGTELRFLKTEAKELGQSIGQRLNPQNYSINFRTAAKGEILGSSGGLDIEFNAPKTSNSESLDLKVKFEEGMNLKDFSRKVKRLENQIERGNAETNIPHGVSDSSRRALTRRYRRDVSNRIESLYKNRPQMRENALKKLAESDIDHILDLQLGGTNSRNNLKSLHSRTNQRLGSQISTQIPRNQSIPINGLEVEY